MQVAPAHLDSLDVVGEAEAEHGPVLIRKLEYPLLLHDLGEWPVGTLLARDRSRPDQPEAAVDPHRARRRARRNPPVDLRQQRFVVDRALELEVDLGRKRDNDGEWGPLGAG
jgi:hypothetical protein